jgi:hypothetical protein
VAPPSSSTQTYSRALLFQKSARQLCRSCRKQTLLYAGDRVAFVRCSSLLKIMCGAWKPLHQGPQPPVLPLVFFKCSYGNWSCHTGRKPRSRHIFDQVLEAPTTLASLRMSMLPRVYLLSAFASIFGRLLYPHTGATRILHGFRMTVAVAHVVGTRVLNQEGSTLHIPRSWTIHFYTASVIKWPPP